MYLFNDSINFATSLIKICHYFMLLFYWRIDCVYSWKIGGI